jgi:hypothetical protein
LRHLGTQSAIRPCTMTTSALVHFFNLDTLSNSMPEGVDNTDRSP